jgi:flagellar motility protein MotE (MotC chaperone)
MASPRVSPHPPVGAQQRERAKLDDENERQRLEHARGDPWRQRALEAQQVRADERHRDQEQVEQHLKKLFLPV